MSLNWDFDGLFSVDNRPVLHCILSMLDIIKEFDSYTRSLFVLGEYYFTTTQEMYDKYFIYAISVKSNSNILDIYCSSDVLYDTFDNNLLVELNKHGLDVHFHITELGYNRNFLSYSSLTHLRDNIFKKYTLHDFDSKFVYLFNNNLFCNVDFILCPFGFSNMDLISYLSENDLYLLSPLHLELKSLGIQVGNPDETINEFNSLMSEFSPLLSRCEIILNLEFYKLYDMYRFYYLGNYKEFYLNFVNWLHVTNVKISCRDLNALELTEEELLNNQIYHNYEEVYSLFFKDKILFNF